MTEKKTYPVIFSRPLLTFMSEMYNVNSMILYTEYGYSLTNTNDAFIF